MAEKLQMDMVYVLGFFFQLGLMEVGSCYSSEEMSTTQKKLLSDLADFGVVSDGSIIHAILRDPLTARIQRFQAELFPILRHLEMELAIVSEDSSAIPTPQRITNIRRLISQRYLRPFLEGSPPTSAAIAMQRNRLIQIWSNLENVLHIDASPNEGNHQKISDELSRIRALCQSQTNYSVQERPFMNTVLEAIGSLVENSSGRETASAPSPSSAPTARVFAAALSPSGVVDISNILGKIHIEVINRRS
jgi:hypothetical protein